MSDRLSREHLESDALVSGYARAYAFYQEHKYRLIFGTLAVLILIGGGVWYYVDSMAQEQEAQEMLVGAEEFFQQGNYEQALYGNEEGETVGFADIVSDYSRTDAANIASYYAAVSASRLGDYEDALYYIERYNAPDGILGVGAISLHASILSNLERFEESAQKYADAADWDENEVTTPQNLLNAAEASYEAGDYSTAEEFLVRIIDNYEDTDYASDAKRMQGMLSAR